MTASNPGLVSHAMTHIASAAPNKQAQTLRLETKIIHGEYTVANPAADQRHRNKFSHSQEGSIQSTALPPQKILSKKYALFSRGDGTVGHASLL